MNPKISIIIPTYGHRDFILKSLDSVFAQTVSNYEVIVINDGSPDDTGTLLKPLIETNRVHYIEQPNQGQSIARNRGLAEARGTYIAFLDDDDLWPPDKLEWQSDYLDQHPEVGMVAGVLQTIDESNRPISKGRFFPEVTFESLFFENPFLSPGQTLSRADVLRSLGGLSASIWGADDWDLWFRIAREHQIVMLDRLALYYRLHAGNASRQKARLLRGCCSTIRFHLGGVQPERRRRVREKAYSNLFDGLGTPLITTAKTELKRGHPVQAVRSLCGLLAFRGALFSDRTLRWNLLSDVVLAPVRVFLRKMGVRFDVPRSETKRTSG